MAESGKFDPKKLQRLNDPQRLETLPPAILWRAIGLEDARSIVEIGAGTGLIAAALSSLSPEAVFTVTDIEPAMVEWMMENRAQVAEGRMRPTLSTETGIPMEDASADVVYMVNLHHELLDPAGTYLEAKRLLRPYGRVLVADWAPVETPKGPPPEIRVTAETLAAFLSAAGFAEIRIHTGLPWHSLITATKPEFSA